MPTLLDDARADLKKRTPTGKRRRATPSLNGAPSTDLPILREHKTDTGNARRLVSLFGDKLRYCHPWCKWLVWDGTRWREDDQGEPERLAKETVKALLVEATRRAHEVAGEEGGQHKVKEYYEIARFALQSESAGKLSAMVALARSENEMPILPAALNSHPWLLNCPNGTVDLQTGKLRPHTREDYITQLCPTPFDPAATCPTFARFVEDILQSFELVQFVQRFMGYCLTGSVSEQILAILFGTGANGKSTLLNAWLNVLGTDYASKAPQTLLVASKGDRHPTEIAGLFGRRLVVATETDSNAWLAESQVKELTGGDAVTARRMGEDFWTFAPTHKLLLATNHKPRVKGRDHAIWRRLRLVPFKRRFEKSEQDTRLGEKLANEAPGILAWMVQGCLQWQRDGLGEPAEVMLATNEYRTAQDVLAAWLGDCCETGNGETSRGKELYASYSKWAKDNGEYYAMTARQLNDALKDEGFEAYRNDGPAFRGIGLKPILPD